jgi:DNA-binding MarR family transcriptional regulator
MKTSKRPTDLVVSTIAMFVLLLFNDKSSYTTAELASILQIDIETLRKNIQSLTQAKYRILNIAK